MSRISARRGSTPSDYNPDRLRAAIAGTDDAALTQVATPIFIRLVQDLSGGAVRGRARVDWHMTDATLITAGQQRLLAQVTARRRRRRGAEFAAADPSAICRPQARARQHARDDTARRDLIRVNMERWRWMPRTLGARHVLVNVPAFTAALIDDGHVTARHRAVVGAVRTPTPQLNAQITAVTINPWWNVPQSIIQSQGGQFRRRL